MIKVPENIEKLMPYMPGKPIEEVERELGIKNVIKLASNENPLGPSPKALAMMKKYIPNLHRYPEGGCFYLTQKLSEKLGVKPNQILIGNGSNEVLSIAGRTFYAPGDHIVYSQYAFIVYKLTAQALGAKFTEVHATSNLGHDLEAMAANISQKTKLVYIANPNNPTGTMFTGKEFERFMKGVPKTCVVVLDEAYAEYADVKDYPDGVDFVKRYKNLIAVRTFSKIHGLAGLRIGYAIADESLIDYMNRVREPFNVNTLAQFAAIGALDDADHIKASRENNREGMAYLYREFDRLKIPFIPSHGNFVLLKPPVKGTEFYNKLLKEGIIVRPVSPYNLHEYVRITVGTMVENKRFIAAAKKIK